MCVNGIFRKIIEHSKHFIIFDWNVSIKTCFHTQSRTFIEKCNLPTLHNTLTHTHTHTLSPFLCPPHTHTRTNTQSHSLPFSFSIAYTLSLSPSLTHTLTRTLSLSLLLSLSLIYKTECWWFFMCSFLTSHFNKVCRAQMRASSASVITSSFPSL